MGYSQSYFFGYLVDSPGCPLEEYVKMDNDTQLRFLRSRMEESIGDAPSCFRVSRNLTINHLSQFHEEDYYLRKFVIFLCSQILHYPAHREMYLPCVRSGCPLFEILPPNFQVEIVAVLMRKFLYFDENNASGIPIILQKAALKYLMHNVKVLLTVEVACSTIPFHLDTKDRLFQEEKHEPELKLHGICKHLKNNTETIGSMFSEQFSQKENEYFANYPFHYRKTVRNSKSVPSLRRIHKEKKKEIERRQSILDSLDSYFRKLAEMKRNGEALPQSSDSSFSDCPILQTLLDNRSKRVEELNGGTCRCFQIRKKVIDFVVSSHFLRCVNGDLYFLTGGDDRFEKSISPDLVQVKDLKFWTALLDHIYFHIASVFHLLPSTKEEEILLSQYDPSKFDRGVTMGKIYELAKLHVRNYVESQFCFKRLKRRFFEISFASYNEMVDREEYVLDFFPHHSQLSFDAARDYLTRSFYWTRNCGEVDEEGTLQLTEKLKGIYSETFVGRFSERFRKIVRIHLKKARLGESVVIDADFATLRDYFCQRGLFDEFYEFFHRICISWKCWDDPVLRLKILDQISDDKIHLPPTYPKLGFGMLKILSTKDDERNRIVYPILSDILIQKYRVKDEKIFSDWKEKVENMMFVLETCGFCMRREQVKNRFKKCGGCKVLRYCSLKCQKNDWKRHKVECVIMVELIEKEKIQV